MRLTPDNLGFLTFLHQRLHCLENSSQLTRGDGVTGTLFGQGNLGLELKGFSKVSLGISTPNKKR
jgi:hypothetical protein